MNILISGRTIKIIVAALVLGYMLPGSHPLSHGGLMSVAWWLITMWAGLTLTAQIWLERVLYKHLAKVAASKRPLDK